MKNFENLSIESQRELLENGSISPEELNYIIMSSSDIKEEVLKTMIDVRGHDLDKDSIDKIIAFEFRSILELMCENYNMRFVATQMRDIIRFLNDEKCLYKHPSYKDFWFEAYVKKEEDFLSHTKNHISNVNILSGKIIEFILDNDEYRSYFNIPENFEYEIVKKFVVNGMELHDKAKICEEVEFLKDNGLTEPLYKTLYSHYGKGFTPELKALVKKLNEIDNNIVLDYLKETSEWQQNLFLKVEKIADCVERGCNKITPEEMNQAKIKPSVYLQKILNPIELSIVKHFEIEYPNYCESIL